MVSISSTGESHLRRSYDHRKWDPLGPRERRKMKEVLAMEDQCRASKPRVSAI